MIYRTLHPEHYVCFVYVYIQEYRKKKILEKRAYILIITLCDYYDYLSMLGKIG